MQIILYSKKDIDIKTAVKKIGKKFACGCCYSEESKTIEMQGDTTEVIMEYLIKEFASKNVTEKDIIIIEEEESKKKQ